LVHVLGCLSGISSIVEFLAALALAVAHIPLFSSHLVQTCVQMLEISDIIVLELAVSDSP
jgi:hypothetical protein